MITSKLTKKDIVQTVGEKSNLTRCEIASIVQRVLDSITHALIEGKTVELRNFGVFEIQVRKARVGRNPNIPKVPIRIPQQAVIKFKAGKELREKLKASKIH
jgi:DNA-binding protein HU-beta/integration host factor subunit alpha